MSVQAWFSHDDVDVEPGDTLTLPLTVHNLGDTTESYSVVPAGLSASWTSVRRGSLTLFGGSQEVIDVEIAPPLLPTTTAGPTVIAVRVIPTSTQDEAIVAEATLGIQPFDDCRIVPLQPIQRARHRATFEFMVENHGNSVASARLILVDPTARLDGAFDPPAVGVPPGAASLVQLKLHEARRTIRRHSRILEFEVEAQRQGLPPASAPLALVQSPTVSWSAVAKILGVAAVIAAAAIAWFGLIEPTIDDSAERAVDDRIGELTPVGGTGVGGSGVDGSGSAPETTVAVVVAPEDETGEPTFFRLAVTPALNETADLAATIPDGEQFDLTDVRIENPANDTGIATLLKNGEAVFVWSLDNVRGQYFEPRITPIPFAAGDNITFSVRCDAIGDATKSTCTNAVNLGGRTTPAP